MSPPSWMKPQGPAHCLPCGSARGLDFETPVLGEEKAKEGGTCPLGRRRRALVPEASSSTLFHADLCFQQSLSEAWCPGLSPSPASALAVAPPSPPAAARRSGLLLADRPFTD